MKNKLVIFFILLALSFLLPRFAGAVCPVCTIAVGAGLGISRALGIDDTITSIWIGGLILSSSFWLIDWLSKKFPKFHSTYYLLLTTFVMYLLVLVPLFLNKTIGLSHNKIFGIDKILFGTILGSLGFLFGVYLDKKIRRKFGKQFIVYQKVIVPVFSLLILSVLLNLLIRITK